MAEKFEDTTTRMCVCGHDFDDHHHGIIMNPQALINAGQSYRNIHGVLGEECEATQFEGQHIPGTVYCNCSSYWDTGWPKEERV